jgi:chromosome segregation ATPase
MSGGSVKLSARPPHSTPKRSELQQGKLEMYTNMKALPNHREDKRVSVLESELKQTREDLLKAKAILGDASKLGYIKELEEQLVDSRYELLLQRAQFEAIELLRPQTEVEALKEEQVSLVDINRSQASQIKELTGKVEHLTIKPEQLQSVYEKYVENYQVKLDLAETKATRLEKELKEIQEQKSALEDELRSKRAIIGLVAESEQRLRGRNSRFSKLVKH